MQIKNQFDRWSNEFKKRTGKKLIGKSGVVLSSMVGLSGLYFGPALITGGFIGATVSGCYYIWNYMTADKEPEEKKFNILLQKISRLRNEIQCPVNLIDFNETSAESNIIRDPPAPFDKNYTRIYPDLYCD